VLRSRSVDEKRDIVAKFTKTVMPKFSDGTIVPIIYKAYALKDVAEAHKTMEQSKHFGKIVLTVDR